MGDVAAFRAELFDTARAGPVLAGFDFPLGLPERFAQGLGFADFPAALEHFGTGAWSSFFEPAATPAEIGPRRPFYPARAAGASRAHLLAGHGAACWDDLLRRCERGGATARTASPLFWTVGAAQVGRAAGHGWQTVVRPCLQAGATLWPFAGASLATKPGLTLCEIYPADTYRRLGAGFRPGEGKRDRAVRGAKSSALAIWCGHHAVGLDANLARALAEGFGPDQGGDDGFDAVVGLLGMIGVADGLWPAGAPDTEPVRRWEGWILGRQPA